MPADGTGGKSYFGDIAISGEKIAAVGKVKGEAATVIDGTGFITCPGFIDPHSHADRRILRNPSAENFIMQGVTTVLAGNCGDSWPRVEDLTFAEWLSKLEEVEKSINIAMLVGHNTVRDLVMGDDFKRHATPDEIEKMKELVDEAMRSGAFGMSAGLDYYPGEYADTGELIELAKVVAIYRGMYVPHLRHCNSHWQAIDQEEWGYGVYHGPIEDAWVGKYRGLMEAIEVCRNSKVNLHLAHMYPAEMLGLDDRGTLSPGSYADIVIFDFNRIKMTGTFLNPAQHPEGIEYVLVNGTIVYKDMAHTGEKPGRLIRHSY